MKKLQILLMCCLVVGFAACDDDKDIDKGVDNDIDFGDVNVKVGELKDTGTQLIWAEQFEDDDCGQVTIISTADYEGDKITALKEVWVFSDTNFAKTFENGTEFLEIEKVSRDGNKVMLVYKKSAIFYNSASVIRIIYGSGGSSTSGGDNFGNSSVIYPVFKSGTENGHDYVDIGLPSGTKWATANVGASKPQDYGNYYAWGQVTPSETSYWSTYLDGNISSISDCGTDKDALKGVTDIAGTQYDAAKANWGGKWRMPTKAQQDELRDQCYWVWTDNYNNSNVKGYIVYKAKTSSDKGVKIYEDETPSSSYSLSDAHIFLPAAGYCLYGDLRYAGSCGIYWSSSLSTDYPYYAWHGGFSSGSVGDSYDCRFYVRSVRAVCPGE